MNFHTHKKCNRGDCNFNETLLKREVEKLKAALEEAQKKIEELENSLSSLDEFGRY